MIPEAGIVMNQATMMLLATPQRTAEILWPAPTPMMLEETTWVVETGPPKQGGSEDDRGRGRSGRRRHGLAATGRSLTPRF